MQQLNKRNVEKNDKFNSSQWPAKRAQTELTLDAKNKLIGICEARPRPTQKYLSDKHGIERTAVSDILICS